MKRKEFFKLLSIAPLLPLMTVKKVESKFLDTSVMKKQLYNNSVAKDKLIPVNTSWGTNYIPGQTDYTAWDDVHKLPIQIITIKHSVKV